MNQEAEDKIVAAMKESGLSIAEGLHKYQEVEILTMQQWNALPAKYRITIEDSRMGFLVGIGWRRIVLMRN